MFRDREFSVSILTWGGSVIFHSLLVLGMLTFLTQVTPTPASKLMQWKVSVVTPTPSSELSEHAQTVKHAPQPTIHSTVSRPQPKRRSSQQRRIQQRQPSIHQTAVVTRPTPQPVHNQMMTEITPRSYSHPSARSLSKATRSSTHQVIPTAQVEARTTPQPKNQPITQKVATHTMRFAQSQVSSSKPEAHTAPPRKRAKPTRTIAYTESIIQLRQQHKSQSIDVPHQVSTPNPKNTSFKTFTKISTHPISAKPQQRFRSSMSRSHASQHTTSVMRRRFDPVVYQSSIFAEAHKRKSTPKIRHQTTLTSITEKAIKSPEQRHSNHTEISDGLSPEVLAFLRLLREKIEKHRQYPRIAKRMGYQGTTTVSFALSHAGDLTLLKVAEPSGHAVLDEAALDAVQSIASLKPPMTIGGTPIEIPVSFELTR